MKLRYLPERRAKPTLRALLSPPLRAKGIGERWPTMCGSGARSQAARLDVASLRRASWRAAAKCCQKPSPIGDIMPYVYGLVSCLAIWFALGAEVTL